MNISKTNVYLAGALVSLILASIFFGLAIYQLNHVPTQEPNYGTPGGGINTSTLNEYINNLPKESLSQDEINAIQYMREEEKLARDVYLVFYDNDNTTSLIFNNIASSEQSHMNAVKLLIDKYGLNDPIMNDTRGVFLNAQLQALYNQLIINGSNTLTNALTVGGIIEEVDIVDLENWKTKVNNEDILYVFDLLESGSENHLRAFTNQLQNLGVTYEPHYLTQEQYNAILSSAMNRDMYTNESTMIQSYSTITTYYLIIAIILTIIGVSGLLLQKNTRVKS